MALNRKYAALLDLDSAPDIYETPELTDDNSTIPTSANRPESQDGFDDDDDDDEKGGISRSRLRINEARSRFLPGHADANGADFSNRVDGKRMLYRASGRRQRILEDGTQELGNFSDDEEEESLERRIARLRREVEEAKVDYNKQASASPAPTDDAEHDDGRLETLSRLLDDISKPAGFGAAPSTSRTPLPEDKIVGTVDPAPAKGPTYTVTYAPSYQQSHALAKAADFDRRLVGVEQALGIDSSSVLEAGRDGLPRALLPTLDNMEKQLSMLSQASTASLDAITRRVRTLASEQDKLNDAREKGKALRDELGKHSPASATDDSEHETKINALYGILPTIEGLTPVLPPLLDRLRSLRAIHADAASASQTLERIETQQTEMAGELKQWRDGLDKMEEAVRNGDVAIKSNVKVMEGWIKDLEERMAKLA